MTHKVFAWSGGTPGYGDARWDGRYAVSLPGRHIETDTGTVPQPGSDARYLRVASFGPRFACGVQAGDSVWEWVGDGWRERGTCCGVNVVIYDAADRLVIAQCAPPTGSQGWRCVSPAGKLVTGDASYADPTRGVWEYTDCGDVVIGQGSPSGVVVRFAADGVRRVLTIPGVLDVNSDARFVRVSRQADRWAITAVLLASHQTVIWWGTTTDLKAMPAWPTQPPPKPPEPPPVPDYLSMVRKARDAFASMPSGNERAWRTINRFCQLAGEDFGLVSKPSGNNYNGFSVDVVMRKSGAAFDCLRDGEGAAVPTWSAIEPIDPKRWRAPVADDGGPTPPEPEPEPPPQTGYDDTQIRQDIASLKSVVEGTLALLARQSAKLSDIETRLANLRVKGSTSRTWSHGHDIDLKVE